LRHRGADQRLQHRNVGGETREDVAGACGLEEGRREADHPLEEIPPEVGGNPLAEPGDEVEPRRGGAAERRHDHEHRQRRMVEMGHAAAGEAMVDQMAETLAESEDKGGRKQKHRRSADRP
jgi:hypothetical protein